MSLSRASAYTAVVILELSLIIEVFMTVDTSKFGGGRDDSAIYYHWEDHEEEAFLAVIKKYNRSYSQVILNHYM